MHIARAHEIVIPLLQPVIDVFAMFRDHLGGKLVTILFLSF